MWAFGSTSYVILAGGVALSQCKEYLSFITNTCISDTNAVHMQVYM